MGILSDSVGLTFKVSALTDEAKSELDKFTKDVKKETDNVSSGGEAAFNSFAQKIGLSAEQTAKLGAALPLVGAAIAGIATAFVGATTAIAVGLFQITKQASDYGSEIKDAVDKTGLAAETLSSMRLAAEQSGTSLEQITGAVAKFSKGVASGTLDLKAFGLTPQAALKDLDGALGKVFETIQKTPEGIEQMTLAQKAFGRSGADLLPFIKQFDGDLPGLIKKAKELGITLSQDDVNAADDFGDQLAELQAQAKGVLFTFARDLLPVFTDFFKSVGKFLSENKNDIAAWGSAIANGVSGTIVTLGKVIQFVKDNQIYFRIALGVATLGLSEAAILGGKAFAQAGDQLASIGRQQPKAGGTINSKALDGKTKSDGAFLANSKAGEAAAKKAEEARKKRLDAELKGYELDADIAKVAYEATKKTLDDQLKNQLITTDSFKTQFQANLTKYAEALFSAYENQKNKLAERFNGIELANAEKELQKKQDADTAGLTSDASKANFEIVDTRIKLREAQNKAIIDSAKQTSEGLQKIAEENYIKGKTGEFEYQNEIQQIKLDALAKEKKDAEEVSRDIAQILRDNSVTGTITDEQLKNNSKYQESRKKAAEAQAAYFKQQTENETANAKLTLEINKNLNDEITENNQRLTELGAEKRRKTLNNLIENGIEVKKNLAALRDFETGIAEDELKRQEKLTETERLSRMKSVQGAKDQRELEEAITNNAFEKDLLSIEEFEAKKKEIQDRYIQQKKDITSNQYGGGLAGDLAGSIAVMGDSTISAADKMSAALGGISDSWDSLRGVAGGAINSMIQGIGSVISSWVLLGNSGGQSIRKFTAQVLAGVAAQSAVLAVFELAKGFAALFFNPAEASAHFTAAALFGSIAAVAAVAGRVIAGSLFQNQSGSGTGSAGSSGSASSSSSSDTNRDRTITEARGQSQSQTHIVEIRAPKDWFDRHVVDDINRLGPLREAIFKIVEDH